MDSILTFEENHFDLKCLVLRVKSAYLQFTDDNNNNSENHIMNIVDITDQSDLEHQFHQDARISNELSHSLIIILVQATHRTH